MTWPCFTHETTQMTEMYSDPITKRCILFLQLFLLNIFNATLVRKITWRKSCKLQNKMIHNFKLEALCSMNCKKERNERSILISGDKTPVASALWSLFWKKNIPLCTFKYNTVLSCNLHRNVNVNCVQWRIVSDWVIC